jgi:NADH:ubiquinone oxidoreductase subunit E
MMDPKTLRQKAPVVDAPLQRHVFVCTGKSCLANNSEAVLEAFRESLKTRGLLYGKRGTLDAPVILTTCGSIGLCQVGPAVLVYPGGKSVERLLARTLP